MQDPTVEPSAATFAALCWSALKGLDEAERETALDALAAHAQAVPASAALAAPPRAVGVAWVLCAALADDAVSVRLAAVRCAAAARLLSLLDLALSDAAEAVRVAAAVAAATVAASPASVVDAALRPACALLRAADLGLSTADDGSEGASTSVASAAAAGSTASAVGGAVGTREAREHLKETVKDKAKSAAAGTAAAVGSTIPNPDPNLNPNPEGASASEAAAVQAVGALARLIGAEAARRGAAWPAFVAAAPLARVLGCGRGPVRLAAAKAVRDLGDAVLLGEVQRDVECIHATCVARVCDVSASPQAQLQTRHLALDLSLTFTLSLSRTLTLALPGALPLTPTFTLHALLL